VPLTANIATMVNVYSSVARPARVDTSAQETDTSVAPAMKATTAA
jgi:hypothetical protein